MISHMGLILTDGGGTGERTERDQREGARTRSWGSGCISQLCPGPVLEGRLNFCHAESKGVKQC